MRIPTSYHAPWKMDDILSESPFLTDLGLRLLHLGEDGVHLEMEQTHRHMNAEGRVHGGVLASLLDVACGFPVRVITNHQDLVRTVTLTLSIDYLSSPRGPLIKARGRIVGGGKKIVFSRGEVLDAEGNVIAIGSGSFKRLSTLKPKKLEDNE